MYAKQCIGKNYGILMAVIDCLCIQQLTHEPNAYAIITALPYRLRNSLQSECEAYRSCNCNSEWSYERCSVNTSSLRLQLLLGVSSATAAREAGIEMGIISRNMGHASVAITEDIYAHITSNVLEEAALKIENQLFGE